MEKFKLLIGIIILAIFNNCSQDNESTDNYYESISLNSHKLILLDTLEYWNNDSIFISQVAHVDKWRDYILITDFNFKKLWVFDFDLNLINTVGQYGSGPGEYSSIPVLITDEQFFWLLDGPQKRINQYDTLFNLISENYLPDELIYFPDKAIHFNDEFIIFGAYPAPINQPDYYSTFKSLFRIRKEFTLNENFLDWDPIYRNTAYFAFATENFRTLLAKEGNKSFFALQAASNIIHRFNNNFKEKYSFGIKPKYFKEPPRGIKSEDVQKSMETIAEFAAKTTSKMGLYFDDLNKRLFANYSNLNKEYFFERSWLLGKHYLQAYNNNYDCIFDGEIPGLLKFIHYGNIYVLTDENPEFIRFLVFRLERK